MVPNVEAGGIFEVRAFDEENWAIILESGIERSIETEFDAHGQRIPLPELHDDWLTQMERQLRDRNRQTRLDRRLES
jgi:hypothetical protein